MRGLVDDAGISRSELVVEIGGGGGSITRELERVGCRVIVIEKDPSFADALARDFGANERIRVVKVDVARFDWPREPFRVFANIPFGITTEILRRLLDARRESLRRADLIVELAVARKRTAAPAGNKLNLVWAPWWVTKQGRRLPRTVFDPQPSVDAAMLTIERRGEPLLPVEEAPLWHGLIETAFGNAAVPLERALRGIVTHTQLRRAAREHGVKPDQPVARVALDDWIVVHRLIRDHVARERWPLARSPRRRSLHRR